MRSPGRHPDTGMDWVCGKSSMLSSARVGCTVQLVSSNPSTRSWSVDSSAVGLAQIHGTGSRRHVLTAQQNILEVRCGAPGDVSFQCYGHHGRCGRGDTQGCWRPIGPGNSFVCVSVYTWTAHGGCWFGLLCCSMSWQAVCIMLPYFVDPTLWTGRAAGLAQQWQQ